MKNSNHRFLTNRLFVHNQFMGLSNPLKAIMSLPPIGGMVSLSHGDKFPMMSTLVCIVTHLTRTKMSYDIKLLNSHDFTKLFHYVVS